MTVLADRNKRMEAILQAVRAAIRTGGVDG